MILGLRSARAIPVPVPAPRTGNQVSQKVYGVVYMPLGGGGFRRSVVCDWS